MATSVTNLADLVHEQSLLLTTVAVVCVEMLSGFGVSVENTEPLDLLRQVRDEVHKMQGERNAVKRQELKWEDVHQDEWDNGYDDYRHGVSICHTTQRAPIPGGYLYRVVREGDDGRPTVTAMCFVPKQRD